MGICIPTNSQYTSPEFSDNVNKVYPTLEFCSNDTTKIAKVTKFTDYDIISACRGYKFAEIRESCGDILCCNDMDITNPEDHIPLGLAPNLENLCFITDSLSTAPSFGAFSDRYDRDLNTLYILEEAELYNTHDYFGCVHMDIIKKANSSQSVENMTILAVYHEGQKYIESPLDGDLFRLRIWDFTADCHNNFYPGRVNPIGMDSDLGKGVAVYCQKGFNCSEKIIKSIPNESDPLPVDLAYRQDKCVFDNEAFTNDVSNDDLDLSEDYKGQLECLNQCRQQQKTASLVVINENECLCTSFDKLNPTVQSFTGSQCGECNDTHSNDNGSFTCGSTAYSSIYYNDQSFGSNQGYKYWHCVNNFPYNEPTEVLSGDLVKVVDSVPRASECLIQCRESDFSLVMVRATEEQKFECTCMDHEFYRFSMQDFSFLCTEVSLCFFNYTD